MATWLLLHGTPMDPGVWDGVRPHLEAVHPVLAPQLGRPSQPRGAQAEHAVDVLASADADALHVVGHSLGGQVAIEVALRAPDRVASLTVLCSRAAPFPAFAAAAANVRGGGAVEIEAALARWFTAEEVAQGGPVVTYVRRCLDEADRGTWADELDAIAAYDRTADLARLSCPTAVIATELDQVGTIADMTAMADAIPGASLEVIARASHVSPFLDPASLAGRFIEVASRAR